MRPLNIRFIIFQIWFWFETKSTQTDFFLKGGGVGNIHCFIKGEEAKVEVVSATDVTVDASESSHLLPS